MPFEGADKGVVTGSGVRPGIGASAAGSGAGAGGGGDAWAARGAVRSRAFGGAGGSGGNGGGTSRAADRGAGGGGDTFAGIGGDGDSPGFAATMGALVTTSSVSNSGGGVMATVVRCVSSGAPFL